MCQFEIKSGAAIIGECVTEIEENAFTYCDDITSVIISNMVRIIGKCF